MGFGEAIVTCYRKYADFKGRARRSEYWYFAALEAGLVTFFTLAYLAVSFRPLTGFRFDDPNYHPPQLDTAMLLALSIIILLFVAANFLPSLAVSVRRLHDLNFSGWWLALFLMLDLLPIVSMFSSLLQFIWFCMPGTRGDNRFGPDPKQAAQQASGG